MAVIKILFIADTHLGFDFPLRPRIERRRRGPDFFKNFYRALQPAMRGEVDCVIHGGDLLYRSKVPARIVDMAFNPLKRVADNGIPVYLVPGNHERSVIPYGLLSVHPLIYIFHKPYTYFLKCNNLTLGLVGFPYKRNNIRHHFLEILEQTSWQENQHSAQGFILCIHQCCEGASVGPKNYTFRYNDDVVKVREIPQVFTAVLSGHIHRFQILKKDPVSPILYPGSIERTSIAEKDETKGYIILEIESTNIHKVKLKSVKFHPLPTRPMLQLEVDMEKMRRYNLKSLLTYKLNEYPSNSVVKIKVRGNLTKDDRAVISAESLRSIAPKTMNIYMDHPVYDTISFKRNT